MSKEIKDRTSELLDKIISDIKYVKESEYLKVMFKMEGNDRLERIEKETSILKEQADHIVDLARTAHN